jgi:3-deoxy-D-manno-octulosonic-acid transferase
MSVYRFLSILLFPIIEIYLFWRVYKKKEDKKRLRERFGKPTKLRPEGDLMWLHAVSVGETNSALIFVEELLKKFPKSSILFTTTTLTSAAILEAKIHQFNDRVIHQFLPIDSLFCVKDFLNFWRPHKVFFIESEIWPNLIFEAAQGGSELYLINARMSEKSAKRWDWANFFGLNIFDQFKMIFAQSVEDQKRISKLTQNEVFFCGNLKSQASKLEVKQLELEKLKKQIGSRKFWLAASTHKGEEEIALRIHRQLKQNFPDLLTIIIPRHPNRGEEITNLFGDSKFSQRSKNHEIAADCEIYLADTLGEIGTFYQLGDFVFLGGSMVEVGGHNPFEPIKLGCAVISGRHVFNFAEIYAELEREKACFLASDENELFQKIQAILSDKTLSDELRAKGAKMIGELESVSEKILSKIA